MKRDITLCLEQWRKKERPLRAPLIIRGARQVGKSWAIRDFGQSFTSYIEINFEKQKTLKRAFHGIENWLHWINTDKAKHVPI